jgi:hypothetical protein
MNAFGKDAFSRADPAGNGAVGYSSQPPLPQLSQLKEYE